MSSAGIFKIRCDGPYPVWCSLYINDEAVCKFTHRELRDLLHVVEQARREAKALLPDREKGEP